LRKKKIYTPQGGFDTLQCSTPCSTELYDAWPIVSKILPLIDPKTQLIPSHAVPYCPKCGAVMSGNLRGGDWFLHHSGLAAQNEGFLAWGDVKNIASHRVLVLEIGCGWNTPVVTRFPAESFARQHNARFIRINQEYSEVPLGLDRALGFATDGRPILSLLSFLVTTSISNGDELTKELIETRKKIKAQSKKADLWEKFQKEHGHFDWRIFMKQLARE